MSNFEILKVKGWAKAHKKIFQSKILILISDNIYINTKTLNEKIIYMNKVYNSQKKNLTDTNVSAPSKRAPKLEDKQN